MENKFALRITPLAHTDIDAALSYIKFDLCNPTAASNLSAKIISAFHDICSIPTAFPKCQYYFIYDDTYRHVNIGNYVLFFRINIPKNPIKVLRFLYGKMDFSKIEIV